MNIHIEGQIIDKYFSNYGQQDELFNYIRGLFVEFGKVGFNLTSIHDINFFYNYAEELMAFQKSNGLVVGFTNNSTEIGFGKVEKIIDDGKLHHFIFYDYSLLIMLLNENEETQRLGQNALFHELCHVHDDNYLYHLLGDNFNHFKLGHYLDNVLYGIALSLWQEYFAHRISMEALPMKLEIESLKKDLSIKERSIKNVSPLNEGEIYRELHKYIEKVVRQIGNFNGAKENEQQLLECIRGTVMSKYYETISSELNRLFNEYPNWESYIVLDNLTNIIKTIWEDLGFIIHRLENDNFTLEHK